jgi:hypothetical protein
VRNPSIVLSHALYSNGEVLIGVALFPMWASTLSAHKVISTVPMVVVFGQIQIASSD